VCVWTWVRWHGVQLLVVYACGGRASSRQLSPQGDLPSCTVPLYCLQVEAELNDLDEADAAEYLADLGVEEGGLKSLIRWASLRRAAAGFLLMAAAGWACHAAALLRCTRFVHAAPHRAPPPCHRCCHQPSSCPCLPSCA
jgi:hypothetical protein